MMTRMLQLLMIALALAGLVIFGFIRDKQEHSSSTKIEDDRAGIASIPNE